MPIGQVILGVGDLAAASRRVGALGLTVLDGGTHPGLGTANTVVPLGNAYLELLGAVDRDAARATAYGRALLDATAGGDRLVRWSIRTTAIDTVAARLGLDVEARRRQRPDGSLLTWRAAGLDLALREPWLPFFMQWDDPAQYPGAIPVEHPLGPCSLAWLRVSTPDRARLGRFCAGEGGLPLRTEDGAPAIVAAGIATPAGELVIDGTTTG